MKSVWLAIGSVCLALCGQGASPYTLYVAPNGLAAGDGTLARPFATLEAARDALRMRRSKGMAPRTGVEIILAEGTWVLRRPLELTAADSGVTWRSAMRATAVLSGGLALTNGVPVTEAAIRNLLPPAARDRVRVYAIPEGVDIPGFTSGGCGTPEKVQERAFSLFQGARRLPLARWPNADYAFTGDNVGPERASHDAVTARSGVFRFGDAARLARWAREPDLWAYGLWVYEWADATTRILAVDPRAGTLSIDMAPVGFGVREGAKFTILNAFSELDRPGEWVLDRANRRIYVWPQDAGGLVLAVAPGLVRAKGTTGVLFDGLTLDYAREDAVVFQNAVRCGVRMARVCHTSAWGIRVKGGSSCRVEGCDLFDLGRGGIELAGGDFATLAPGHHVAENNHIHHYGEIVPNYQPGVQLSGVGNAARHNLIHHSRHQAIAFHGNDHHIAWNAIHNVCLYNDDAGAIYCCQRDWARRGTVIERNLIHMTGRPKHVTHTEAIYLDDFSSGVIVRDNVINRASTGIYIGGGQDNTVSGNVVMNCRTPISLGSRGVETFASGISGKGRSSEMFTRLEHSRKLFTSSLWQARYPFMMRVFDFPDPIHAHDAHFNRITNNLCVSSGAIAKGNWKFVKDTCIVTNNLSVADDPGFEDYVHFKWELKPGAARDFVGALHLDEMGLYPSPYRVSPAVKFGAGVTPPPPFLPEYAPADVRIDVALTGALPAGIASLATDCVRCAVPAWGKGKRLVAEFRTARTDWTAYQFRFTPACDARMAVITMGARGEKTLYDDFIVMGATLLNGGFEGPGGWGKVGYSSKDYRAPLCNLRKPWGVLTAAEAGCPAAEGAKMACGHDMINFTQVISVKKGVPVTIRFQARALPEGQ